MISKAVAWVLHTRMASDFGEILMNRFLARRYHATFENHDDDDEKDIVVESYVDFTILWAYT